VVVQVTFNEPIDPLSVNSSTFYLVGNGTQDRDKGVAGPEVADADARASSYAWDLLYNKCCRGKRSRG
jgi:hypothetical protein